MKFLDDNTTYPGNRLESKFGGERCFGVLANMEFIPVCTYEKALRSCKIGALYCVALISAEACICHVMNGQTHMNNSAIWYTTHESTSALHT